LELRFGEEGRSSPIPVDALLAIAKMLSAVDETGEIDATNALFLATGFEAAVETGAAAIGIDAGNRATFRWGLERWAEEQDELPPWALEFGRALDANFANPSY
jgi:hypothetical protein